MLIFSIGLDELERNQSHSILSRVIKSAYAPLASTFLTGGVSAQSYILQDRTNVSLHKNGTKQEVVEVLKGV